MINNWRKLPKEHVDGLVVVELAYDRGPKKAYITLMPTKLAELIDRFVESGEKMGAWIISNTNHYYRIQVKMYRKVWIALTMRAGMDESWRDALQGRIPSIQVRHYVENIQDAVEYYKRAFEKYMQLL
jgi:intergrase/recombinase